MKYTKEFDADTFGWWSGAKDTIKNIRAVGLIDELTAHIKDVFGCNEEPPTATDINDYVWFESENIYKALGLNENGELPRSEK